MKNNSEAEAAIAQVSANANPHWKDAALDAVYRICLAHETFFADDVWDHFIATCGDYAINGTHDKRALGPVMRTAATLKWCMCTNDYRRVRRNHNHLRPVWKSLLYKDAMHGHS